MRRIQAIDSLVTQALRVMVLAAGRASIPAMPAPVVPEVVLDVETLRQIIDASTGAKSQH